MNAEPNHGAPAESESSDAGAEAGAENGVRTEAAAGTVSNAPAGARSAHSASTLRGRIRPLPAETDEETFLPFLDLCFNWSMDRPRIEIDELRERSDASFYYRDWGRNGDIAVAAHAESDPESPIIGLAWVRLADIADVVGKADDRVGGDFAAALGKTGAEVVRSDVVPAGDTDDESAEGTADDSGDGSAADNSADDSGDGTHDGRADGSAPGGPTAEDEQAGEPVPTASEPGGEHGSVANQPPTVSSTPTDDGTPFTGYGWVAADIPELSIAVLPDHQGQGIGGVLIDTVCALVRMSGFPAVSLSVEDGNGAAKLYADHGFVSVGRNGDSDVLVRRLRE